MIYNTGLGHGSYEPIEQTHFLFRTSFKCPSHQKRGELSSHIVNLKYPYKRSRRHYRVIFNT